MTASAALRTGDRAPVPLQRTPFASPDSRPGEITVILGYTPHGEPVAVTIASVEWAHDLLDAAAGAIVRADTHLAVTA